MTMKHVKRSVITGSSSLHISSMQLLLEQEERLCYFYSTKAYSPLVLMFTSFSVLSPSCLLPEIPSCDLCLGNPGPRQALKLNTSSQHIDFRGQLLQLGGKTSREPVGGHGQHYSHIIWTISSDSALKTVSQLKAALENQVGLNTNSGAWLMKLLGLMYFSHGVCSFSFHLPITAREWMGKNEKITSGSF